MRTLLNKLRAWAERPGFDLLLLAGVSLLAYGLLLPRLGIYWDDFPILWIGRTWGAEGLARYFSTNRPVWGLLYQFSVPLIGVNLLAWHALALALRFGTAAAFWLLLRVTWPGRRMLALGAALLFLLFPAFGQQSIAIVYSHFYVVIIAFLLSLAASVAALRETRPARRFWLTAAALLLGLYNLLAMEYFFLLEFTRPLLLWAALGDDDAPVTADRLGLGADLHLGRTPRQRLGDALKAYLPYLSILAAALIWRLFLFPYQTENYEPVLARELAAAPLQTVLGLLARLGRDLYLVTVGAWVNAFTPPDAAALGARSMLLWAAALIGCALGVILLLGLRRGEKAGWKTALTAAGLGLIALLLASGPFVVTNLPLGLDFPNDRFTLPHAFGTALLLAGLIALLPGRWARILVLAALVGSAAGLQVTQAVDYSRDWSRQRSFFWQLAWRAPSIEPGVTILTNDLPIEHYSDNSLTAALNWIYAPENRDLQMSYLLYYPAIRLPAGELPALEPGHEITVDYLAAEFNGSTERVLPLIYNPPACLRVLDPDLDAVNWMTPRPVRDAAALFSTAWIVPGELPALPEVFYGGEPEHNWCYYFARAELAREDKDWQQVAALGDEAFTLGDYPNDPAERLVFIEGYAHSGNWARALELSAETRAITPVMERVVCRLWQRIDQHTPPSAEKTEALRQSGCE